MDDADLKRVAEAATPGPWRVVTDEDGLDFIVSATHGLVTTPERDDDPDGRYLATFDPPTVLSILSRLSAAEARVGVLEGALKAAPILSKYHGMRGFEVERFISDYEAFMARVATDRLAQALTQEPTP